MPEYGDYFCSKECVIAFNAKIVREFVPPRESPGAKPELVPLRRRPDAEVEALFGRPQISHQQLPVREILQEWHRLCEDEGIKYVHPQRPAPFMGRDGGNNCGIDSGGGGGGGSAGGSGGGNSGGAGGSGGSGDASSTAAPSPGSRRSPRLNKRARDDDDEMASVDAANDGGCFARHGEPAPQHRGVHAGRDLGVRRMPAL